MRIIINIPTNYNFKRADRGTGSRGGCGIIISDKVAYIDADVTMKTNLTNIEAKWNKIKTSNIYVCGFLSF